MFLENTETFQNMKLKHAVKVILKGRWINIFNKVYYYFNIWFVEMISRLSQSGFLLIRFSVGKGCSQERVLSPLPYALMIDDLIIILF